MATRLVRGRHVALPDGVRAATIVVRDGRIAGIRDYDAASGGAVTVEDAGELVVLPGLVDTHVHVNEPGRTEWEGFSTATRAAAAGGVTTIVDMPLNSVPCTTSVAALDEKRKAAGDQCHVDVGFWGGVVPGNAADLEPLARAGVLGFKCFLSPSGVAEFDHVGEADLRIALPILARLQLPLLVHAEDPAQLRVPDGNPRSHATWLRSRPAAAEHAAIAMMLRLAAEHGARVHIVHLAAADALPLIDEARRDGVRVTVETCPHYLHFAAEDIADGATPFKCAPPIRGRAHREGLWDGLRRGSVDLIATDHSPAPPALKELRDGDFVRAWGGIASLQLGLRAVWTGMKARELETAGVARWMAAQPARLAGLDARKGRIAPGLDADLVFFDPDAASLVRGADLYHRHAVTPYDGLRLRGLVRKTMLRGEVIFDDGVCCGAAGGRFVMQSDT